MGILTDTLIAAIRRTGMATAKSSLQMVPTSRNDDAIRDRLLKWERVYAAEQASATFLAVRSDCGVFTRWCVNAEVCGLPMHPEDLRLFLHDQVVLGKKLSTLSRYVATLKLVHVAAGLPDPTEYSGWRREWEEVMLRLGEEGRSAPKQAMPLRSDGVSAILASLGNDLLDLRDGALLALAADTLCRESELVDARLEDLSINGSAFSLYVRKSKRDEEGLGTARYCSIGTRERIDHWCEAARIASGYLFPPLGRLNREGRGVPNARSLSPAQVGAIFRKRAISAGLPDASSISSHSVRIGSALELIESGASLTAVQHSGGWQSDRMVLQYGRKALIRHNATRELARLKPG